jgi:thiol-disulfide isomerase/thioredoxin
MADSEARSSPPWRIMLVSLGLLALAASAVGIYYATQPGGKAEPIAPSGFAFPLHAAPRPLPQISFEDGQGRKHTLAEFRGRTVLLNIWATWCVPCRKEMPALDRLEQKLGGPGFEVLALSIDTQGVAPVRRFYDEIGIRTLAIYVDSTTRSSDMLGVIGIPTTLLVDPQGREVARRTGPAEWDSPEALAVLAKQVESTQGAKNQ